MKRTFASVAGMVALVVVDVLATCGGGGGGGTGGMGGGGAMAEVVYQVPWKSLTGAEKLDAGGLVVYWFPASENELKNSSLRNSRSALALRVAVRDDGRGRHRAAARQEVRGRREGAGRRARAGRRQGHRQGAGRAGRQAARRHRSRSCVETEIKQREAGVKDAMNAAKDAAKKGDKDAAIAPVPDRPRSEVPVPEAGEGRRQRAEEARRRRRRAGRRRAELRSRGRRARSSSALKSGLMAENMSDYAKAEKFYTAAAHASIPPTRRRCGISASCTATRPATGTRRARRSSRSSRMPADPLSRAVALHGIGKMTIHDGEFQKGLHLMEQSADVFPAAADLSQPRRLLALGRRPREGRRVHEEGARARSRRAVQRRVRRRVRGRRGRRARARRRSQVAQAHEDLLCASYNLAAIYAQLGDRNKALALLKRHFYEYEQLRRRPQQGNDGSARRRRVRVDRQGPRVRGAHRQGGRQAAHAVEEHATDILRPTIRSSRRSPAPRPAC